MNAAQNCLPRQVARLDVVRKPFGGLLQESIQDKLTLDTLIALQYNRSHNA